MRNKILILSRTLRMYYDETLRKLRSEVYGNNYGNLFGLSDYSVNGINSLVTVLKKKS